MSNEERMAAESTTHPEEKHSSCFCKLVKTKCGVNKSHGLTLSGGVEGAGRATVVVKTAVVVDGEVMTLVKVMGVVTTLVKVMGGFSPPGVSGTFLSLCWEPMNRPRKIEQSRRKTRRRMSKILLRGVSGS